MQGVSSAKTVKVDLGLRIEVYNIKTGQLEPCVPPPLLLQPQAASEPPSAYNGFIAQRGSGVRNDLGFKVTVNVSYREIGTQSAPTYTCSVERNYQHQRMAPAVAPTPSTELFGIASNINPNCAMSATPQASFTVDLKYASANDARGSVLLCRDRSVRLRPKQLEPDAENKLRPPPFVAGPLANIEDCVTTTNSRGGLNNATVTGCFVQRRSVANPWTGGHADFYMFGDSDFAVSGLGPHDLWSDPGDDEKFVLCENLQICRINGTGSPVTIANLHHDDSGNVFYRLSFSLNQNQAGCLVYVETAQVDVAGNLRQGIYQGAYMAGDSPGKTEPAVPGHGYCINSNNLPTQIASAYANCLVQNGTDDGLCPCYADRVRVGANCASVGNGYYSVDDLAADDTAPGVACSNGPGGAPPSSAAALNFEYYSPGHGNNTCDWECINGYTKVPSPPSCVPPAIPTPTATPPCPAGSSAGCSLDSPAKPFAYAGESLGFCAGERIYASPSVDCRVSQPSVGFQGACGSCEDANFSCPAGSAPYGSGGLVSAKCYCIKLNEVWSGTACIDPPTPTPTATPLAGLCGGARMINGCNQLDVDFECPPTHRLNCESQPCRSPLRGGEIRCTCTYDPSCCDASKTGSCDFWAWLQTGQGLGPCDRWNPLSTYPQRLCNGQTYDMIKYNNGSCSLDNKHPEYANALLWLIKLNTHPATAAQDAGLVTCTNGTIVHEL